VLLDHITIRDIFTFTHTLSLKELLPSDWLALTSSSLFARLYWLIVVLTYAQLERAAVTFDSSAKHMMIPLLATNDALH
jgi:hypothetical protein